MSPRLRRIVQAVLYETIAVVVLTPIMAWVFDEPLASSFWLTVSMSAIALTWNYVFNAAFERWEARQVVKGRSGLRRLVHGVVFELGLGLFLVPFIAWWLSIGLWEALLADIGFMIAFFLYTMVFTWGFDKVFGLPESAR